jgi:hypothetical protein
MVDAVIRFAWKRCTKIDVFLDIILYQGRVELQSCEVWLGDRSKSGVTSVHNNGIQDVGIQPYRDGKLSCHDASLSKWAALSRRPVYPSAATNDSIRYIHPFNELGAGKVINSYSPSAHDSRLSMGRSKLLASCELELQLAELVAGWGQVRPANKSWISPRSHKWGPFQPSNNAPIVQIGPYGGCHSLSSTEMTDRPKKFELAPNENPIA